jgi:hypothetical protein
MPIMLTGANDLARRMAESPQVAACAATNLATYMLDHSPDVEGSCELEEIKARFQRSGSFADLFVSILTSPAFLTRDL